MSNELKQREGVGWHPTESANVPISLRVSVEIAFGSIWSHFLIFDIIGLKSYILFDPPIS